LRNTKTHLYLIELTDITCNCNQWILQVDCVINIRCWSYIILSNNNCYSLFNLEMCLFLRSLLFSNTNSYQDH
jgi:hypothetical protein